MASAEAYAAIDLGAESGRVLRGRFDGERVDLAETHRFPNRPVLLPDGLHWDVLRLFDDALVGLGKAGQDGDGRLAGVAVDAWGVDFGLLDRDGALLGNPYHYRDARTEGVAERVYARVPRAEISRATGIQHLPFNTLYQLAAMEGSPQLAAAHTLLMVPDLISSWLCGEVATERTIASTTQLYDPRAAAWATDLIERVGIPAHLFAAPLVSAGTALAPLRPASAERAGLRWAPTVFAVGAHDTASAVVAVPAAGERFAYVSSGTWSLVGVETPAPVMTAEAFATNLTNEAGVGGTTRLLKNVMGLWLVQECRRAWAAAGSPFGYDELVALAEDAPPFGPTVDPDHPALLAPGDMPARLRDLVAAGGQTAPDDIGGITRCALESLALKYRWAIERIERVVGWPIEVVHVVGGGARNDLLCRLTAASTRRQVVAGPVEATALGNVLVQAMAAGRLGSVAEARDVVRRSIAVRTYDPGEDAAAWDEAYARFERTVAATPAA